MAGIPEPAEGNFGEGNVCTGVDPQECARIANVLALETAVQEEENALQAEKIERLQVMLEQYLSQEDESAKHDNILEIGDAAKSRILEPMDTVSASKAGSGHDDLAGDRNDAPAKIPTAELMRGISSPGITGLPHREGMHTFRKLADAVIDLALVTSPYSGSTTGDSDDVAVCGNGAEQGFSGVLEPGSTITIRQTSNTFDSKHTLRYGGVYPGDNVVQCVDDPDTAELSFTNAGNANVPVYFIVDAHISSGGGDFVVAWSGDFVAGGEFLLEYFLLNYM